MHEVPRPHHGEDSVERSRRYEAVVKDTNSIVRSSKKQLEDRTKYRLLVETGIVEDANHGP